MSERWKFQLKVGLIWSILMTVFMVFKNEKSFNEQLNSSDLYVRLILIFLCGIFIMGYITWKGQDEKYNSWNTFFKRKPKKE
jgi:antibiotic biosynthesis monooxygenase (ABM) superfamily enzyme